MKKFLVSLMLLTGISRETIAQQAEDIFEIPSGYFTHRFMIDLGKGNTMQIEFGDTEDAHRIKNIDSMINVFMKDLIPFKDSLADENTSKKIDYLTDLAGRKKIRLFITRPVGSTFLIRDGNVSSLKNMQDTIRLIGIIKEPMKVPMHKKFSDIRYYRISFFMNQLSDLQSLTGKGLGDKIDAMDQAAGVKWKYDNGTYSWHPVKGEKSISAEMAGGNISGSGDQISSHFTVNVQNYKNYFTPSVNLGIKAIFNNGRAKKVLGVSWEPNFIFDKDITGRLKTFRNDFITLSFNRTNVNEDPKQKYFYFTPNFSLSYLLKRQGDYFDKNTFRLGVGEFKLFKDKVKLEPVFYFTDFFKHTTPGLRISVAL